MNYELHLLPLNPHLKATRCIGSYENVGFIIKVACCYVNIVWIRKLNFNEKLLIKWIFNHYTDLREDLRLKNVAEDLLFEWNVEDFFDAPLNYEVIIFKKQLQYCQDLVIDVVRFTRYRLYGVIVWIHLLINLLIKK